jgi:hypothetical protein
MVRVRQNEIPFKGSQLETEIRNTNDFKKLKKINQLVFSGFEKQPKSIFWNDACEMVDKKVNYFIEKHIKQLSLRKI